MNTTSVDAYLADGCGRCDLYRTLDCKVHRWTEALVELRAIALRLVERNRALRRLDDTNVLAPGAP